MAWQLHVRFDEMELRDVYWEQAIAMPPLAPLLKSGGLRTRLPMAQPVVVFECDIRETLAKLCRWTLDYWPSAQIALARGGRSILNQDEGADIYLETDTEAASQPGRPVGCKAPDWAG